jgi:cell division protease FtsH
MPPRSSPPPSGKPRRRPAPTMPGGWFLIVLLGLALVCILLVNYSGEGVSYGDFKRMILEMIPDKDAKDDVKQKAKDKAKNLEKIYVASDHIRVEVKDKDQLPEEIKKHVSGSKPPYSFTTKRWPIDDPKFAEQLDQLLAENPDLKAPAETDQMSGVWTMLSWMLPLALLVGFFVFFVLPRFRDPLGGGFLTSYIKSPARRYDRSRMRITFDDVADMQNAKGELQEIVEFLRSPEKFQRLGAQIPKGVLLVGPPGTGKTLLARAVAGEAGVPFFSINGSEFIQMFVGVGASRVRDMFKTAKENAPCILFIDEIDAVGRMRGAGVGGGSDEREQTLNQILSEMDGFLPTESVIVMAATNRPDVLDSALLRPGRFDRHITVDRPTWQGRLAILKVHTRNKPLADDVNLDAIARKVIGMTGADLRNLANEAALLATREGKAKIDRTDFERAADRVLIGPKREEVLTPEDKRRTAYHEAGHALVTWKVPGGDRPIKVSIIPRGQSLGVNLNVPEEERFHYGLDHFKAKLVMMMGGRAADRLVYGQPYAGAEMDLKQATRLARNMVTHWGMSDRLGPIGLRVGEEHIFLGKEIQEQRDFSEGTAQIIDEEVQRLVREADEKAYDILQANRDQLDRIVEALLQREELLRDEIDALLGEGAAALNGSPSDRGIFTPDGKSESPPVASGQS